MKKKILFALLTAAMTISLAACGGSQKPEEDKEAQVTVESAEVLLNNVWDQFAEDEKFAVVGGDAANSVENAAGKVDISDTETVTALFHISEDGLAYVKDAASLMHMMNANTFTAAAYQLEDAANAPELVDSLKESISGTRWMCGFPEMLHIYTVADEYVTAAFGNADNMEHFKTHLTDVYGDSAVLSVEMPIE